MKSKEFYRNRLPHLQPLQGTFFVTYNLSGVIPTKLWKKWREQIATQLQDLEKNSDAFLSTKNKLQWKENYLKKVFAAYDHYLDREPSGPHHLKDKRLSQAVADSLHFWDNKKLELLAYCIMSNHVHVVMRLFAPEESMDEEIYLDKIMHSVKLYSARACNEILGTSGAFWQHESYDRLIRDKNELYHILRYVINNPVEAGLCSSAMAWPSTYIKECYNDLI